MHAEPRTMPCLSLTQPWASLVATSNKMIETRSWRTSYRGPLAIHAAKRFPPEARTLAMEYDFWEPLSLAGYTLEQIHQGDRLTHDLPLGAVVATCHLVDCVPTREIVPSLSDQEEQFGDYTSGRWAWVLAAVRRLPEPISAVGHLGFWEWTVPDGVAIDGG